MVSLGVVVITVSGGATSGGGDSGGGGGGTGGVVGWGLQPETAKVSKIRHRRVGIVGLIFIISQQLSGG